MKNLFLIAVIGCFTGCYNAWEDHVAINQDVLSLNLGQYLKASPEHTIFASLVNEVGMDTELVSLMQFTIIAPDNAAMQAVPPSLLASIEARRLFVEHHVTLGHLLVGSSTAMRRVTMLSDKVLYHDPAAKTIGGVEIPGRAVVLVNGYFYTTATAIKPLPNIWDYVQKYAPRNKHVNFLNSLTRLTFAPELSTRVGVDGMGRPVYDSVFVYRNDFNDNVVNLAAEDSTLTLFIIEDQGFDAEYQKFWRYYMWVNGRTARDTLETRTRIARDYVFTTAYPPGRVPAVVESPFGVSMNFNETSVVSHFKASNGYVYLLTSCPVALEARVKTVILEGENPANYFGLITERGVPAAYTRKRALASGGRDFVLDNHVSGTGDRLTDGLILPAGVLPSTRYRVYWRAINDFRTSYRFPTDNQLMQRLGTCVPMTRNVTTGRVTRFAPPAIFSEHRNPVTNELISDFIPVTATAYTTNPLADEVFVGTVNFATMREVFLQLQPQGVTTRNMAVTVDYIKLVPVFH